MIFRERKYAIACFCETIISTHLLTANTDRKWQETDTKEGLPMTALLQNIFANIWLETLSVSQNIQNKCGVAAVLNENIWTQKDYQSRSKLTPSLFPLRMVPFNIGAALLFRYSSESKSSGITAKKWEAVDSENFVDCEIPLKAPVIVGYERSAEAP